MRERIYKYRITCREFKKCGSANIDYETTEQRGLPEGWVEDDRPEFIEPTCEHYCAPCWKEHCEYMASRGVEQYKYYLEQLAPPPVDAK